MLYSVFRTRLQIYFWLKISWKKEKKTHSELIRCEKQCFDQDYCFTSNLMLVGKMKKTHFENSLLWKTVFWPWQLTHFWPIVKVRKKKKRIWILCYVKKMSEPRLLTYFWPSKGRKKEKSHTELVRYVKKKYFDLDYYSTFWLNLGRNNVFQD